MSGPSSKRSGEAFSGRSWNATANASLIVHTKCQSALRSNACQQQLEPGDRSKSPKTDRPGGHRSGRTPLKNADSVSNGRHSGNLTSCPGKIAGPGPYIQVVSRHPLQAYEA